MISSTSPHCWNRVFRTNAYFSKIEPLGSYTTGMGFLDEPWMEYGRE